MFGSLPRTHVVSCRRQSVATQALFGGGKNRDEEKEEMFRRQQEIIAERRANSNKAIKEAEQRRRRVSAAAREKEEKKRLAREAMSRGEVPERGPKKPIYTDEDNELGIVIPLAPFGIPKYDQGERFDLRSPYVDKGWVDKTKKEPSGWFKNLLGGKKKPKKSSFPSEEDEEED